MSIRNHHIRIWIATLGVLSVSSSLSVLSSSVYSPDLAASSVADEFTPPRSHHHSHSHSHHFPHSSHHQNHQNGRREHEIHENRPFHYHQQQQQRPTAQTEYEQQQSQYQNQQPEEILHHQEDSPYYGGYSNVNKLYNVNLVHHVCRLPDSWKGNWFLSGFPNSVSIDSKSIEGKGTCYENSGDKFLFVEQTCHRCVVINQRHLNVIEFKESAYCEEKASLDTLCSHIPGDAQLYSLFRLNSSAIPCPFKPPYTFTYNKGFGQCKNPVSHVDQCTDSSRILLRFESCPDIKSESQVQELQCLAHWKDTTYHYLVGKVTHQLAVSNEDQFRCFIYEKGSTVVKIASGGEASCSGLSSPYEGAKTLTFTKVNEGGIKCKFPNWVSSHHWHSLDRKLSVKTNHKNSTMHIVDTTSTSESGGTFSSSSSGGHHHHHHTNPNRVGGGIYNSGNFGNSLTSSGIENPYSLLSGGTRITCQATKELSSEDHIAVVAQHTEGCKTQLICMHFFKRSSHVIELQMSKKGSGYYDDYEYDCWKPEALGPNLPYVTLIRPEVNQIRCPYLGKYMATGVSQDGRSLAAGGDLCITSGTAVSNPSSTGMTHRQKQSQLHSNSLTSLHSVVVGCGHKATLDFHTKCVSQEITSYECHGSWENGNGTGFFIASPLSRSSSDARRFSCFTYLETEFGGLQFFSSSESCRRDVSPNVEGIWAFNLTVDGQCAEPMTASASSTHCDVYSSYFLAMLLVLLTFSTSTVSNTIGSSLVVVSDLFYSLFAKILSSSSRRRISSRLLTSQHHSSRRMTLA